MPHRPSKSELRARDRLLYNLYYLQRDDFIDITLRDQVPEAWHTLELDVECSEPKEKITLYLDRSVVRLFRAMGRGYQGRINRLLSTWAQMKIAAEVALEDKLKARLADPDARASSPNEVITCLMSLCHRSHFGHVESPNQTVFPSVNFLSF